MLQIRKIKNVPHTPGREILFYSSLCSSSLYILTASWFAKSKQCAALRRGRGGELLALLNTFPSLNI